MRRHFARMLGSPFSAGALRLGGLLLKQFLPVSELARPIYSMGAGGVGGVGGSARVFRRDMAVAECV